MTPSEFEQATREIDEEVRRQKIDRIKQEIYAQSRAHRWWHKFVPFVIKIERRK